MQQNTWNCALRFENQTLQFIYFNLISYFQQLFVIIVF